jgi:predicted P-loop ATPase
MMETKQSIVEAIKEFLTANYRLAFNEITRNLEVDGRAVDDMIVNSIFIACKAQHNRATYELVRCILYSDFVKKYDPLKSFIESNKHIRTDGKNMDRLIVSIKTDTPNHDLFVRKWLCSIMATIHGKHSPLMLVLCGGQNSGKTEWFRRLLPDQLKHFYAESKLDEGKDADILMTRKLIVMDDEMGGKSKSEQKRLKEMTSKQVFSIREPYGRVSVDLRRLAMLCGTTNDHQILSDPTGNRRILPINVLSIDHRLYNSIDKNSLFIEIYRLWQSKFDPDLSSEEIKILNDSTGDFKAISHEEDLILKYFAISDDEESPQVVWLTCTDIVDKLNRWSTIKINTVKVGQLLKALGFKQVKGRKRLYPVIELNPG